MPIRVLKDYPAYFMSKPRSFFARHKDYIKKSSVDVWHFYLGCSSYWNKTFFVWFGSLSLLLNLYMIYFFPFQQFDGESLVTLTFLEFQYLTGLTFSATFVLLLGVSVAISLLLFFYEFLSFEEVDKE